MFSTNKECSQWSSLKFQLSTNIQRYRFFYDPKTDAMCTLFKCKKRSQFDRHEIEFILREQKGTVTLVTIFTIGAVSNGPHY